MQVGVQDSNDIVESQLKARLDEVEKLTTGNALAYIGTIDHGPEIVRRALDAIKSKKDKLSVILDTPGGYIEVAERLAVTFRHHYACVEFIVPGEAMSAGTVLVMSGDAIWMDYSSTLGPIDPQVRRKDGDYVPALGYLEKYKELVEKSKKGTLTTAEMVFLTEKFDPGELYQYEQARDLSIALLKEWLVKYKFKNWQETETRRKKVTPAMRVIRARQIAAALNKTSRWHSHSRGLTMEVLRRDLKLLIDDFGQNPALASAIRDYYWLLMDYMAKNRHGFAIATCEGYQGH